MALSDGAAAAAGSGDSSLLGDGLCLLSALLYAAYTVLLQQQQLPPDDADAPAVFFGVVGVGTAVAGLPVLLALQLLGVVGAKGVPPGGAGVGGGGGVV